MKNQRNDYTPGYVYVLYDCQAKLYKIGLSRNPDKRRYYLSKVTAYGPLKTVSVTWVANMKYLEHHLLHRQFATQNCYRGSANGGTEWFALNWWQVRKLKALMHLQAWLINLSYGSAIALVGYLIFLLVF